MKVRLRIAFPPVLLLLASCPLPFDFLGGGPGSTHASDPSSPRITAAVTVSFAEEGGESGIIAHQQSHTAGRNTTVTLSTETLNAVIYYTDDGNPVLDLISAKKITGSSGSLTITRTTSLRSVAIHALAVGPSMVPSQATRVTVIVSPYPVLSISRSSGVASEDNGTSEFIVTSSDPAAGDIPVTLVCEGDYEDGDVTGVPGIPATQFVRVLTKSTSTFSIGMSGLADLDAEDETVRVRILPDPGPGQSYSVGFPDSAEVVIRENGKPTLALSADRTSMADGQSAIFTVSANKPLSAAYTVGIASSGYDSGKLLVPPSVTMPAGTTSARFTVSSPAEIGYEVQNAVVSLATGAVYSIGAPASQDLRIYDDAAGPFQYVGVWTPAGPASKVGAGTSWVFQPDAWRDSFGNMAFPTGIGDATARIINAPLKLDRDRFTLALNFGLFNIWTGSRCIIAGGTATRWLVVWADSTGRLRVSLNNHTFEVPIPGAITLLDNVFYTLVLTVDVPARKMKAWWDGAFLGDIALPPSFSWAVPLAGDEYLTSTDSSTGRTMAGTWCWVFLANGVLDYPTVMSLLSDPKLL